MGGRSFDRGESGLVYVFGKTDMPILFWLFCKLALSYRIAPVRSLLAGNGQIIQVVVAYMEVAFKRA